MTTPNTYRRNYDEPKPTIGVPALSGKTAPEIAKRIAMLGEMDDRHKEALNNRDKQGLRELAIEYDAINCPRLTNAIRTEARVIRRASAPAAVTA